MQSLEQSIMRLIAHRQSNYIACYKVVIMIAFTTGKHTPGRGKQLIFGAALRKINLFNTVYTHYV